MSLRSISPRHRKVEIMLELILCSLFTIVPDYVYRRYAQGKRLGVEINLYSVWYELRYGITACLMLTVALITIIFYHHPTSAHVNALFRTIPILPETIGRVAEVNVGLSGEVEKGAPIFKLDSAKQKAALEVAIKRIAEVEASMVMARADIAAAGGQIQQAMSAHQQAVEELQTKEELQRRNPGVVAQREVDRLRNIVEAPRAESRQPMPPSWPPRLAFRRFCRPRRPAPRQRARTPRLISPRQPSMPACPVGSSNSSSGSATSSIRSGARPEYLFHRERVSAR
jgi:hypothetical protein